MMDFRQWLARQEQLGALQHITEPTSPYLQVSHQLTELEPKPVIFDDVSGYRVAGNIFCSRDQLAECLQIPKADFLSQLSRRLAHPEPMIIDRQEIYGDHELPTVDLHRLPILFHYPGDGGYYITSAVWIVDDPIYGRNLSYHRMMVLNERHGSVRVVENRGMHQALNHTGGKATVAICIGPPPAVLLAASFSPPYQVDEMKLAGKLDPIELANCKTIDIKVPVNCEMVLEGHFTGQLAEEGPFVDITGTWDVVRRQPVVEITRVAYREQPIYHALVPGRSEHKVLMGMPKELDIFQAVNHVCLCQDVHITSGGCSWLHAVVQIKKQSGDDGKKALEAAFQAHRSLKHCVVVDDDVDIHDIHDVEWAIATRFQADRDLIIMTDQPSSSLDPSATHIEGQKSRGAKLGLDATIKKIGQEKELFKRVKF